jgi:hypothetical protein
LLLHNHHVVNFYAGFTARAERFINFNLRAASAKVMLNAPVNWPPVLGCFPGVDLAPAYLFVRK